MQASHKLTQNAIENFQEEIHPSNSSIRELEQTYQSLKSYLDNMKNTKDSISAEEHESIIIRLTHDLGRAALSEMLGCYDINADVVSFGEQTYRRKHKAPKTYQTAFGSVTIDRHVYVNRKKDGDGKSICPLELQLGMVEGYWTPIAAKNAAWALAHLTAQEVEELFLQFGKMNPSRSSLDRLPKALMNSWEQQTIDYHKVLINEEPIPKDAVTVAVSLDGVMVAMKPNKTPENKGKVVPCDWKEASCGTISFFDKEGERLSTIQYGRMPEHKKQTLKDLLQTNLEAILKKNPKLNIVHLADGAQDNWSFFDEAMPPGFQLTDFYHACQYLKSAYKAAYTNDLTKAMEKFQHYKKILKEDERGIEHVLRGLRYLRQKNPDNKDIHAAVTYFTNNQHRMKYAQARAKNYPIGSGVVEAACKSLVGQRMKRTGMSWGQHGGQSILTLRALVKSHRFENAWELIRKNYQFKVHAYENVVNLFG